MALALIPHSLFSVVLWIVSIGIHLSYDAPVARGTGRADVGGATMLLFFAVSLTVQRWLPVARSSRLRRG
jgi:hypothetical protein